LPSEKVDIAGRATVEMSDDSAQFLITVYELCLAAEFGDFTVVVKSTTGEQTTGVPAVHVEAGSHWPCAGPPPVVKLADGLVDLEHTVMCAVLAPGLRRPRGTR
jgi:hypothetical protein